MLRNLASVDPMWGTPHEPHPKDWGKPDMSVIDAGRRTPPAMPPESFGDLWPVLTGLADAAGAPVDYVAVGVLVAAASLIGGKRRVRPWANSDWEEPAILWASLVGDPSANKSPALDRATKPMRAIEREDAESHKDALQRWEACTERAKAEKAAWADLVKDAVKEGVGTPPLPDAAIIPEEPQRRRAVVQDATVEALASILSGNPAGTLMVRDELAGWLNFDKYSNGNRAFWLEAFGGRPFIVDRLKNAGKPICLPFSGVSVVGGIQPDRLSGDLLTGVDDGLVARFIWCWPDKVPFGRPNGVVDGERLECAYRTLDSIAWGASDEGDNKHISLPLTDQAASLFENWGKEQQTDADDAGPLYKGTVGKMPGIALRLALVIEYLRWADGGGAEPQTVSHWSLAAALELADEYIKPMALRVYGDAALPPVERNAATLARYIVKNRPPQVNAGDIRRHWRLPGLKTADAVRDALELLAEAQWLRPTPTRQGETSGRQRSDFTVNPKAWEVCDGQVA